MLSLLATVQRLHHYNTNDEEPTKTQYGCVENRQQSIDWLGFGVEFLSKRKQVDIEICMCFK